ncbi:hypothetical protein OHA72_26590 [Dactylosporangium sp. NBC_01737]|nr:hypothetical protein OHA72_26590 [Dactylosporangium sp. NBC_01737]
MTGFDQARGRARVQVGAERDDQDVRLVRTLVGLDPPPRWCVRT